MEQIFQRKVYIQLCVKIELKRIMTDNLKVFLEPFRLNPVTGLPCKLLIYCHIISNTFGLFDEVAEVIESIDSNFHKESREKMIEEGP